MAATTSASPLPAAEVKRRYELMCADAPGTHSPAAWRTMADLLGAAADVATAVEQWESLVGRETECLANAKRAEHAEHTTAALATLRNGGQL